MPFAGCGLADLPERAAGAIGTGAVYSISGLEGRWGGSVRPTDPACGGERHGLMRVGNGQFAFDPFQSTTLIGGTVEGSVLSGTLTRTRKGGPDLSIRFEGQARRDGETGEAIEGVLTSGACRWQVSLRRV